MIVHPGLRFWGQEAAGKCVNIFSRVGPWGSRSCFAGGALTEAGPERVTSKTNSYIQKRADGREGRIWGRVADFYSDSNGYSNRVLILHEVGKKQHPSNFTNYLINNVGHRCFKW